MSNEKLMQDALDVIKALKADKMELAEVVVKAMRESGATDDLIVQKLSELIQRPNLSDAISKALTQRPAGAVVATEGTGELPRAGAAPVSSDLIKGITGARRERQSRDERLQENRQVLREGRRDPSGAMTKARAKRESRGGTST